MSNPHESKECYSSRAGHKNHVIRPLGLVSVVAVVFVSFRSFRVNTSRGVFRKGYLGFLVVMF